MGVGRNLAYTKKVFFKNKGFASHANLKSGDDDLFVNEAGSKHNVTVENHPDSFTYSEPPLKWTKWYHQKRRHLTTANFYQQSIKFMLSAEFLSRTLYALTFIILLTRLESVFIVIIVYIISIIVKMIIFIIVFGRMKEKYLFLPSVMIEPFLPIYYGYVHFVNYIVRRRNRWK